MVDHIEPHSFHSKASVIDMNVHLKKYIYISLLSSELLIIDFVTFFVCSDT